jgi:hypothetical protein
MMCKVLVVSLLTLAATRAATISIQPASSTTNVGSAVNLNVNISNVSNLFAFQFDIGFNPSVLSASSVSEGPFLLSGGTTAFVPGTTDNLAGTISFTADSLVGAIPGVSGDGVLATLQLLPLAIGTSPMSLSNITLLDSNFNSIDFTSEDGSITVNASLTPEPSPALTLVAGLSILFALRRQPRRR